MDLGVQRGNSVGRESLCGGWHPSCHWYVVPRLAYLAVDDPSVSLWALRAVFWETCRVHGHLLFLVLRPAHWLLYTESSICRGWQIKVFNLNSSKCQKNVGLLVLSKWYIRRAQLDCDARIVRNIFNFRHSLRKSIQSISSSHSIFPSTAAKQSTGSPIYGATN